MTVTARKIRANRQNARKSTGPKTPEGKARSAGNARRPTWDYVLTPVEHTSREFTLLHGQLKQDLRPRGVMQEILVERIASLTWKMRRLQYGEEQIACNIVTKSIREELTDSDSSPIQEQLRQQVRGAGELPPHEIYFAAMGIDSRQLIWMQKYELQLQRALHQTLREYQRLRRFALEMGEESDAPDASDPEEAAREACFTPARGTEEAGLRYTELTRTEYDTYTMEEARAAMSGKPLPARTPATVATVTVATTTGEAAAVETQEDAATLPEEALTEEEIEELTLREEEEAMQRREAARAASTPPSPPGGSPETVSDAISSTSGEKAVKNEPKVKPGKPPMWIPFQRRPGAMSRG